MQAKLITKIILEPLVLAVLQAKSPRIREVMSPGLRRQD
jgi:hypothetical protein